MRALVITCTVLVATFMPVVNAAETTGPSVAADSEGIELKELLERCAKRLNKRFIVDPRLAGRALLVNIDPDRITYPELQAILSVHGFIATQEIEGTVRIVPDANMRQIPMPVLEQGRNLGEEDVVTRTIDVSPLNPAALVPLLRPLMPQPAHLVAHPETSSLILVDRQGNVRKMEAIVRELRSRPTHELKASAP